MHKESLDSNETDDDLPPTLQSRIIPRWGRLAGNGRSYSRMYSETDMEDQIHQLGLEAYSAVLRAFRAQADTISWKQYDLISELERQLGLTDEDQSVALGQVNADNVIRRIREWRRTNQPGLLGTGQAIHDSISSHPASESLKKQTLTPSQSYGGPSSTFHPQRVVAPKMKKNKPGLVLPSVSSMKKCRPSSRPGGRNQRANRVSSSVVKTMCDDDDFWEAVITDFQSSSVGSTLTGLRHGHYK